MFYVRRPTTEIASNAHEVSFWEVAPPLSRKGVLCGLKGVEKTVDMELDAQKK